MDTRYLRVGQQKVQPHQIARTVLLELVVVAGVAPAAALDGVEKVVDDLAQGHGIVQVHPDVVEVFHVDQDAPLLLAKVHQAAHIVIGGVEMDVHKGLLLLGDLGGVGVLGGVRDGLDLPVGEGDPVLDAGGGGDKVEVEFPFQPLSDDLHVQQAQKAAPEAEAQRRAVLGLVGQGGVVQLQLFQRVFQVGGSACRRRGRRRRTPWA